MSFMLHQVPLFLLERPVPHSFPPTYTLLVGFFPVSWSEPHKFFPKDRLRYGFDVRIRVLLYPRIW